MPPVVFDVPSLTPVSAVPLLVVCGFVLMDVLVGLAKAFATSSFASDKMRQGLWHKVAILAVVILAMALELASQTMDFSSIGFLPDGFTLPVTGVVAAYVVLMEAGSILESIVQINPELRGTWLLRKFEGIKGKGGTDGDGK